MVVFTTVVFIYSDDSVMCQASLPTFWRT